MDETVEDDTTYHYAVAGLNSAGEGTQSTSSATTLPEPQITSQPTPEPEEPLVAAQQAFDDNPIVTFASNLDKTDGTSEPANQLTTDEVRLQQSFTTGASAPGFLLDSFSFRANNANDFLIVSLWTDESGAPGEKLAELGRVELGLIPQTYTFEYLDMFLFPSTTYWVQFQVRHADYDIAGDAATTTFTVTAATDMDAGGLNGWSFGGPIKFSLKGREAPSEEQLVELVSNRANSASNLRAANSTGTYAQSFTTGTGNYQFAAIRFEARAGGTTNFMATIHSDTSGNPSATPLFTLTGPPISSSTYQEYTYTANAQLDPNTTYWIVFANPTGQATFRITNSLTERGIATGWALGNRGKRRTSPTSPWQSESQNDAWLIAVDGRQPQRAELPGQDFPATESTPGRVQVGTYSTGTLQNTADTDWFKIEGLEHNRWYRLEVDFLGANVIGGGIDIFSSRLGEPAKADSALWDSNYGGHAVIDFTPTAAGSSTFYVQVESDNKMNRAGPRNRYTGPYTITINELSNDLKRMVSNLEQRATDRLTFYNVGHLVGDNLVGHVKEWAIDFTTGSHSSGYTLDKLAAYISMGRQSTLVGTAVITSADTAIATPPYVVVEDNTLTVHEDGDVTYTVKLSAQPSDTVTVDITYALSSDLTVAPASLTFTTSNWDTAQSVTVSAAEDADSTDDDVILYNTATGGGYHSLTRVAVRVDDADDTATSTDPPNPGEPTYPVFGVVPTNAQPQVVIYSNNSAGNPGSELCQVERLTGYETGLIRDTGDWPDEMYAGTCAGVTLEASTTYWVVFRSLSLFPNTFYRVAESNSNSEDASGVAGWSIGNQTRSRLYTSSRNNRAFQTVAGSNPLAIGIYATPK